MSKTRLAKGALAPVAAVLLASSLTAAAPSTAVAADTPPVTVSPESYRETLYSAAPVTKARGDSLRSAFQKIPTPDTSRLAQPKVGDYTYLDPSDVAMYAKAENLSLAAAGKQMLLERQAGILGTWLEDNNPATYGELRIERQPFRIDFFTTADPKTALDGAPLANLKDLISVTRIERSKADLVAASDPILETLRAAGLTPALTVDVVEQKFVLEVPDAERPKTQDALAQTSARVADQVPVIIVQGGKPVPAKRTYGGLWANFNDNSGCTSAVTALRNDNIRVTYTAAHCSNEGDILLDGVGSHFRLDYEHANGDQDIQQMYTTEGNVDQAPWIRDNQNPSGDATPYFRDVFSTTTPAVNSRVWRFGRTTGLQSGIMYTTTSVSSNYQSQPKFHKADVYVRCGDSGGPVFIGNAAAGIISSVATSEPTSCTAFVSDDMIYMPFRNSTMNSWPLLRGPL